MCLIIGGAIMVAMISGTVGVLLYVAGKFDKGELFDCGYGVEDKPKQ